VNRSDLMDNEQVQQWIQEWQDELKPDGLFEDRKQVLICQAILEEQRQVLLLINKSRQRVDEAIVRKFLHRIDLEEERLRLD